MSICATMQWSFCTGKTMPSPDELCWQSCCLWSACSVFLNLVTLLCYVTSCCMRLVTLGFTNRSNQERIPLLYCCLAVQHRSQSGLPHCSRWDFLAFVSLHTSTAHCMPSEQFQHHTALPVYPYAALHKAACIKADMQLNDVTADQWWLLRMWACLHTKSHITLPCLSTHMLHSTKQLVSKLTCSSIM